MPGIKPIYLPIKPEELTIEAIEPFFSTLCQQFQQNAIQVKHYRYVYENGHKILSKKRRYEDDSEINNIVATPHLWSMVNFKSGYALGNPKEYSETKSIQTDDIIYLNKYCKDAKMRRVDKEVITEVYAVGSCYYFIESKSLDEIKNLDLECEAPFNIWCKPSDTCAKVYSSYNGNKPLFDVLFTAINAGMGKKKTVLSLYLPDNYYEIETENYVDFNQLKESQKPRQLYKKLPLVEKYANSSRIGIVEIGESLQNAIDRTYSNQVDNIEEFVNALLIFKNCLMGNTNEEKKNFLKSAKECGAIEIADKNPDCVADIKTLTVPLNHSDVLTLIESLKAELYSSCGVPLSTSDTSNGGNKAGALQLGNGWENAYNRLLDEINVFVSADYEVLERILFICKNVAKSKINELNASDIDIKYNPNMSDDMDVKALAYRYFNECNVPPEIAIAWCRLSNDPITQGKIIEEYKKGSEAKQTQTKTSE